MYEWVYRERTTPGAQGEAQGEGQGEGPGPAWVPTAAEKAEANLGPLLQERGNSFERLHRWSVEQPQEYWTTLLKALKISASTNPRCVLDAAQGAEKAVWLPNMELNIAESCFAQRDPDGVAIVWQDEDDPTQVLPMYLLV